MNFFSLKLVCRQEINAISRQSRKYSKSIITEKYNLNSNLENYDTELKKIFEKKYIFLSEIFFYLKIENIFDLPGTAQPAS